MAAGDSAKFPLPITFDDDEPNAGCARLTLTVNEMTVKKPLIGAAKPQNAEITFSFDNGVVRIHCIVTKADGNKVVYEYKKNLPYDVVEKDCTVEVRKKAEPQIVVTLAKAKRESWASQSRYFMQPPSSE